MEFAFNRPKSTGADDSYQAVLGRGFCSLQTLPGRLTGRVFVLVWQEGMNVRLLFQVCLVALGSALGGLARWGVGVAAARLFASSFPWGTFFINMSGSLFLGWFSTVLSDRLVGNQSAWLRPDDLRLMIAVGFTGAYTTFSTFEYESHGLLRDGDGLTGMTYMFGSVFLGLLAVRLGIVLGRWR
jgi:CrcB protein